jgi:hypothetical protein
VSDRCNRVEDGNLEPLTFSGIAFHPLGSSEHFDRWGKSLPGDLRYLTFAEYVRPKELMRKEPRLGMFAD